MIHIQSIVKQFGEKILFDNADGHIGHRSKVALIGPNGAGKTTLIKMILGLDSPDTGQVTKANHLAIGYLSQEVPRLSGRNVLDEVMRLDGRREVLKQAQKEFEDIFSQDPDRLSDKPDELERYGRILEELEQLDEYRLESRAKTILQGMGFQQTDFNRSLSEFSGGWLMRVALSRILLMEPDLLLLDEPTNHLDLESLLWLEEFLRAFRGAILVISHDRAFLNRIVSEVLEVDQKRLWSYRGNLDAYVVQKEERLTVLRSQYAGQQAKVAEIQAFVKRFGAKATKARQAQSRLKQLEKMDLIELPDAMSSVRFRFPPASHSGKEVVIVKDAAFSFKDKKVFRDLNWVIKRGSRTAIVGVNGAGKTTLLRMIAQTLRPTSGEVRIGHEVKVGYYAQMQAETLEPKKSIFDELQDVAPTMPIAQVRAIAGAFLFSGSAVEKRCSVLSGGEKARVALAKLLLSPSNFLILDEPTNHLDADSREVLLEALQGYDGTLVLVSHDREFMAPLVDTVLEISKSDEGSLVNQLLGGYEDYLERKTREVADSIKNTKENTKSQKPTDRSAEAEALTAPEFKTQPSNNQRRSWERERSHLENEISKLEVEQTQCQTILADDKTYQDKAKTVNLIQRQKEIEQLLTVKMARWEELCRWLS